MQSFTKTLCGIIIVFHAFPSAYAEEPEYEVSASYVSQYVDRGATVSGQQSWLAASVEAGNISAGVSYARTLGDGRLFYGDEIDINFDYSFDLSPTASVNMGLDIVNNPVAGGLFDFGANDATTIEVYAGLSFDALFAPSLTSFYDIHLKGFTLEVTAEHTIPVSDATEFSLGLTGGYAAIAQADDNLYLAGTLALGHSLSENLTAFAQMSGGLSSGDTFQNIDYSSLSIKQTNSSVWFEIGLSSGF